MASSPEPRDAAHDDLDDLFDYDIDEADLRTLDISVPEPKTPPREAEGDDLGLDAEVKVAKARRPTVKLDEKRLLAEKGIPKLRKEAPKILKFKGKGHEYRDAERLLSYYQHWADELFRKGKFRDTLAIIEKIGHSRTMKWERESWLLEGRAGEASKAPGDDEAAAPPKDQPPQGEANDDDLYSAPSRPPVPAPVEDPNALFRGAFDDSDEDMMGPDDDEIEALLAASAHKTLPIAAPPPAGGNTATGEAGGSKSGPSASRPDANYSEDEMDEMMAYMDSVENTTVGKAGSVKPGPVAASAPKKGAEDFEDEMDEMMSYMD